ncbi:GNAT family N-acetyltransferase [Iodobacter sp.]|uniref:GNAT family N-acetyltransferase n=1 Tax=Iodobacter sp. TaxID=1915058 RepID=UPI0025EF10AE|nr:GNAT family N-acetyltransferase [Iodobacter sp.]
MQITPASDNDAPAIAAIHIQAWQAAYIDIVAADYLATLCIEQRTASWRQKMARGASTILVAKQNHTLLGWINFAPSRDQNASAIDAEIWALYVASEHWSSGVGQALLLQAKAVLAESGFQACSLWVFPQNDRAIKFYTAAGFVHDGAAPKSFTLGSQVLQEIRYICPLMT